MKMFPQGRSKSDFPVINGKFYKIAAQSCDAGTFPELNCFNCTNWAMIKSQIFHTFLNWEDFEVTKLVWGKKEFSRINDKFLKKSVQEGILENFVKGNPFQEKTQILTT